MMNLNENKNIDKFLDQKIINDIMPHGHPFLFLNKAYIYDLKANGSYSITGNEYFLQGHFKSEPIFPASIMVEALGQLAVLYLLQAKEIQNNYSINKKKIMFASMGPVSCHKICKPGDNLLLNICLKKIRPPLIKFKDCIITCNNTKVLFTSEITLAFETLL